MDVDRVNKAVGVDANKPDNSPAVPSQQQAQQFKQQLQQIALKTDPQGSNWHPGNVPSQVVT